MPKYWVKNYFAHGRFPEVGQKQKTEKKEKRRRRLNDGDNNGQATHGAHKHVGARKPPGPTRIRTWYSEMLWHEQKVALEYITLLINIMYKPVTGQTTFNHHQDGVSLGFYFRETTFENILGESISISKLIKTVYIFLTYIIVYSILQAYLTI